MPKGSCNRESPKKYRQTTWPTSYSEHMTSGLGDRQGRVLLTSQVTRSRPPRQNPLRWGTKLQGNRASLRGISDEDDSDSDVWTGQKKKHGAPVSTLGYFSEDIDPTARKYVRGDARTKHLRSTRQWHGTAKSEVEDRGGQKKTIEAPG